MWKPALKADVAKQTAELVQRRGGACITRRRNWTSAPRGRAGWKPKREIAQRQVALFRESRWVKLGRKVGLGPVFAGELTWPS